jgi:DNA polymerase elongation subunit (family B)
MGDNTMWFISSPGRLQIDLLPYIRRNHNLDSYSLDNVSATFVSGDIKGLRWIEIESNTCVISTKSTKGLSVGRYITLMDEENDRVVEKCLVTGVESKTLTIHVEGGQEFLADQGIPVRWAQVKDDVKPKDIFRLHRGTAKDRAIIARYCLQDCDLVMELFHKLEILNNSVAMASVCSVPVSYIFLRGQGIKIESLIFKECRQADQLIEVMPSRGFVETLDLKPLDAEEEPSEEEDSYEGAIVLDPKTGIYIDDPITADDFASLYPSSIISENISHDTLISVKDYDLDGKFVCIKEGSDKYDNIPGASYVNIEFDILRPDPGDMRKHPEKLRMGTRVARYIQNPQGTIPRILEMLLASRKKCRKQAETEPDEFRKALLDAQQLAYKLTANSLYGQLGSGTFKIRRQVLAASTTAYGRKQLMYAKAVIERLYGGGADPRCDVECIYGDTDSIFLRFRPKDPVTGKRLTGKAALIAAKALTVESGKLVSACLKPPHDFEFDKIFKSFCLLSKKRYVGDMSEDGLEDDDFHRKSMGIVMKRRDNAPIVKYVYRKAIDAILNPRSLDVGSGVKEATAIVQSIAHSLLQGKFPLSKLTITKSLRAEYKDPLRIAHKVLADRIGERDPGNKPSTSDRIPYVYITKKGPVPKLQGDRIELPSYIKEHGLSPDYAFYITNQIAKPVAQVFGLAVEHIPGVKQSDVRACANAKDPVAAAEKLADTLLFQKVLLDAARNPATMEAKGQRSIASMFA